MSTLETGEIAELETFVDKNEKLFLFNKFYVKVKVTKGVQTVMKAHLTTMESPYSISLYMPAILNRVRRDLDKYEVTVSHNPGHKLEVITFINNRRSSNKFRIVRTGNGDEREFEILGKKLLLTDNSLKTKFLMTDRSWLEPKISWQGRLPNNAGEAEAFLLENRLNVEVKGSRRPWRNFVADLSWRMDRLDLDYSSPWSCRQSSPLYVEDRLEELTQWFISSVNGSHLSLSRSEI